MGTDFRSLCTAFPERQAQEDVSNWILLLPTQNLFCLVLHISVKGNSIHPVTQVKRVLILLPLTHRKSPGLCHLSRSGISYHFSWPPLLSWGMTYLRLSWLIAVASSGITVHASLHPSTSKVFSNDSPVLLFSFGFFLSYVRPFAPDLPTASFTLLSE